MENELKKLIKQFALMLIALGFIFQSKMQAQQRQSGPAPILFIYDASGSMWGQMDGKTKKEIASDVLSVAVNNLPDDQSIGLIAYGHREKGDCRDVEFLVDISNNSKTEITSAVKGITPLGKTPLAYSATRAIQSLKDSKTKATIILITDGIESCDGNICDVITAAKEEGIDFKLHIVGFGLKEGETEQLECAAKAGDGNYYDASDASRLSDVLIAATTETIDNLPGNFSVFAVKNGEPVDAWVRAKKVGSKDVMEMDRSYRDSAWIYLPPGKYDIEIVPLENTDIPGTTIQVEMKQGDIRHENISFDGGKLEVQATNNGEGWDAIVKMYPINSKKVAANARTYSREQFMEVPAGMYKVTFQALAMKGLETFHEVENVVVEANATTELSHNFDTGIAMIGVQTAGGELIDATVNFTEIKSGKHVAGGRTYTTASNNPKKFLLNPGEYAVKIVTLGAHKGHTETFTVTVKKGETMEKKISY
jgi:Ca-activated chloride channel family protein